MDENVNFFLIFIFQELQYFENAFIMLYAPWDGDSQNAKSVIERVAQTLMDSDT